jgi:hypothetical protein
MSQINTNGINVNYPVPGTNNSTQGFRDNFTQITTQLNTAATELTDLQTKAVLKAALNNTALNNDMANTLISNAATSGFRSTSYNLGNALAGTVLVNVNQADVQYGAITGNVVTLQFGNWSPTNTESNVILRLNISNPNTQIQLPSACISTNNNYGVTILENYSNVAGTATLTVPANVSLLEYKFSSLDCGNTITVEPLNRPYQATQVIGRDPPPTGIQGDVAGDVAVGSSLAPFTISNSNSSSSTFTTANTASLYCQLPITFSGFTGNVFEANITAGTTYYVRNVVSSTTFTVSSTIGGANVALTGNSSPSSTIYANPASYVYIATNSYSSTSYAKNVSNTYATGNLIKLSNTTSLTLNSPIVFTGNVFGGLAANTVYYVSYIDGGNANIAVSQTRYTGVAGPNVVLSTANAIAGGTVTATCYVGPNIWKRLELHTW